jgi:acetoacetyl-CoA synthetase
VGKLLWTPSKVQIEQANMVRFIDFVNKTYDLKIQDYWQLYQWSVDRIPDFWAAIWKFAGVIASKGYDTVVDDLGKVPGARWFPGAKLNFAENLLKCRDNHLALIFR